MLGRNKDAFCRHWAHSQTSIALSLDPHDARHVRLSTLHTTDYDCAFSASGSVHNCALSASGTSQVLCSLFVNDSLKQGMDSRPMPDKETTASLANVFTFEFNAAAQVCHKTLSSHRTDPGSCRREQKEGQGENPPALSCTNKNSKHLWRSRGKTKRPAAQAPLSPTEGRVRIATQNWHCKTGTTGIRKTVTANQVQREKQLDRHKDVLEFDSSCSLSLCRCSQTLFTKCSLDVCLSNGHRISLDTSRQCISPHADQAASTTDVVSHKNFVVKSKTTLLASVSWGGVRPSPVAPSVVNLADLCFRLFGSHLVPRVRDMCGQLFFLSVCTLSLTSVTCCFRSLVLSPCALCAVGSSCWVLFVAVSCKVDRCQSTGAACGSGESFHIQIGPKN